MQIISHVKKYWEELKGWLIKENINLFIEKINCVFYNGNKDINMMMMMMMMIAKIN